MKLVVVLAIVGMMLIYLERLRHLQYTKHPAGLVTQHVLGAIVCVVSGFYVWQHGVGELPIFSTALAAACLVTSRDICAVIRPEKRWWNKS